MVSVEKNAYFEEFFNDLKEKKCEISQMFMAFMVFKNGILKNITKQTLFFW